MLTEETGRAALALLVEPILPERRAMVLRLVAETVAQSYQDAGLPVPAWLRK